MIHCFWHVDFEDNFQKVPNRRSSNNYGDIISPEIATYMTGEKYIINTGSPPPRLLCCGSIVGVAQENDKVWGCGLISDSTPAPASKNITFAAVRGPLTRKKLIDAGFDVPEIYADSGILLKFIHPGENVKNGPIGIVPHYADRALYFSITEKFKNDSRIKFIDIIGNPKTISAQIRSCSAIISSSLHGIVAAESFGIPAMFIRMGDRVVGGNFKFNDYYLGTGREPVKPIEWKYELIIEDVIWAAQVAARIPPPNFNFKDFIRAFPYPEKNIRLGEFV